MSDTFQRIAPEQARQLRENGAQVVDIRDPQSFAVGHISGSRHIDNHSVADFIAAAVEAVDVAEALLDEIGGGALAGVAVVADHHQRSVYPADTSSGEAE